MRPARLLRAGSRPRTTDGRSTEPWGEPRTSSRLIAGEAKALLHEKLDLLIGPAARTRLPDSVRTIVGSTRCGALLTRMKYTCAGGSSRLLRSLLAARGELVGLEYHPGPAGGSKRLQCHKSQSSNTQAGNSSGDHRLSENFFIISGNSLVKF